jgi:hypothetical protein
MTQSNAASAADEEPQGGARPVAKFRHGGIELTVSTSLTPTLAGARLSAWQLLPKTTTAAAPFGSGGAEWLHLRPSFQHGHRGGPAPHEYRPQQPVQSNGRSTVPTLFNNRHGPIPVRRRTE